MKRLFPSLFALLLLACPAFGQDRLVLKGDTELIQIERVITTVIKEDRALVKKLPFKIEAPDNAFRTEWIVPPGITAIRRGKVLEVTYAPKGELVIEANWGILATGEEKADKMIFNVGDIGPIPPGPDPKPPIPVPVTSFRVVFVAESGKTLTKEQNSVIAGKAVRDWLTANTTPEGSFAGWRHYDPQQTVANESPSMKRLWEAVQPKLSGLPCVVIEVNGHAEIIPLAATPAEMVETFKKYKSGGP